MNKFTVKLSNQEIIVWADNHHLAMKKALNTDTDKPFIIAALSCVLKDGDEEEDELLFSCHYLKNNGYLDHLEWRDIH